MTETAIKLAAKLYEMRDGARRLLGNRYAERMAVIAEPIRAVMERCHCNELAAAQRLAEASPEGGFDVIFIMAAAVEMIEPTVSGEPHFALRRSAD